MPELNPTDDSTIKPARARGRLRKLLIAACVGCVAALAGDVALASIPAPNGVISACYAKTGGALRVIDPSKGQSCSTSEKRLSWNAHGLNWLGPWSAATTYAIGDAVTLNGSSWFAITSSHNSPPPSPAWGQLAAAGSAGPQGSQGPQGPQGPPGIPSVSLAKGTNGTEINGSFPTLVSLSLPAGKYLLTAKDVPYDTANQMDTVVCYLEGPGGFTDVLDVAEATVIYNPDASFGIATLTTTATLTLGSPGIVYLQCGDNFNSPTSTASSGAVLTAMPVV